MRQRIRAGMSFLLRLGLSAGLLWIVFQRVGDRGRIAELIRPADIRYIVCAFILFCGIHCVLLVRWRLFIKAFDLGTPWKTMTRYFFLGLFGNLFLPTAIGGDVIKAAGLCVGSRHKQKVVASVLLDRLSGFASMVVVSCAALAAGFSYFKNPVIWLSVLVMGGMLAAIGTVLFVERLYAFFCRCFWFLPKVRSAVMQMHYDIALLRERKGVFFQAIAVSCLAQTALAAVFFLLARALHQEISFFYFMIVSPLSCVAASFPSIGGLGFREGALEYFLVYVGLSAGIGVSVGLLNFLFMVILGVFGGVFFVMTKSHSCREG